MKVTSPLTISLRSFCRSFSSITAEPYTLAPPTGSRLVCSPGLTSERRVEIGVPFGIEHARDEQHCYTDESRNKPAPKDGVTNPERRRGDATKEDAERPEGEREEKNE